MVLKRCAITNAVRPSIRRSNASWIWISVRVSTLLVASSSIKITEKLLIPVTLIGAVSCFIFNHFQGSCWPDIHYWGIAIYIGVGPMAAGYFLWTYAMSGDGAKILAPIGYATPLLSTVLLLASGEDYTQRTLYGIALVLSSSIGVLFLQHVYAKKADQE